MINDNCQYGIPYKYLTNPNLDQE